MEFKDFSGDFISYNKRIYKKLIIFSILVFYFLFLIYYNYFSVILGNEIGVSWVYGILSALITTLIFFLLIDILVIAIHYKIYVLGGAIITSLISFFLSIILPLNFVYAGDLQMVIGCIIGIRYTLKNIKLNNSMVIYGIIVGLEGTILTVILFIIFEGLVLSWALMVIPFMILIRFEFYLIEALIISSGTGIIIGSYYYYKNKKIINSTSKDDIIIETSINK